MGGGTDTQISTPDSPELTKDLIIAAKLLISLARSSQEIQQFLEIISGGSIKQRELIPTLNNTQEHSTIKHHKQHLGVNC